MMLRVSGKNLDVGEALRGEIEARLRGAIAKYFDGGFDGHAVVEREGSGFRTHCVMRLDSGVQLQSSATAHNPYASADMAGERIEKRLRRYGRRLKGRQGAEAGAEMAHAIHASAPYTVLQTPGDEADEGEGGDYHPVVVAETSSALPELSVGRAVVELDLTGAPVVVFRHASTGRLNVVYRRVDGNVGWVDPAGPAA